ncbi:MAG: PilZ domain-containing protein [Terriglobia bacterium]
MITATERRRAQRFPLDLPLEVKWEEATSETLQPANIRDISATGVYFMLDRELRLDSKVEFFVRLKVEGAPPTGVLLHCVGSIVRVERKDEGDVGVAARIDRYRFVRPGEGPLGVENREEE